MICRLLIVFLCSISIAAQTPTPTPAVLTDQEFEKQNDEYLSELRKLEKGQNIESKQLTAAKPNTVLKSGPPKWEYITTVDLLGNLDIYNDRISNWDNLTYSWLKIVIRKPQRWAAKSRYFRGVGYFLQYATADCNKRRLTRENTSFYTTRHKPMIIPGTFLVDSINKPVIPLSVDEQILDKICKE